MAATEPTTCQSECEYINDLKAQIEQYSSIVESYTGVEVAMTKIIKQLCIQIEDLGGDVPRNILEIIETYDRQKNFGKAHEDCKRHQDA